MRHRVVAATMTLALAVTSTTSARQTGRASSIGAVVVPIVRSEGNARTWTLRYRRIHSTAQKPGPPIVFLAGGPGDAGTRAIAGMPPDVLDPLLAIADVVAFDQRGTGTSDPAGAVCPPVGAQPLDRPTDPAAWAADMRMNTAACAAAMAARGIPARAFTTEESADDLAELRVALGVQKITLWAGSYGTHLALAAARRHPDAIDRMALFGVEGPDDTLKRPDQVDAVLQTIDRRHPGTIDALTQLLAQLRAKPWTKMLPNGVSVTVGAWDLQRRVWDALAATATIDALPAALASMSGGDFSDIVRWAIPFRAAKPINLMHAAMDCASWASPERLAAVRATAHSSLLGDAINAPMPDICEAEGMPRLSDAFRAPLQSRVPALLVAGALDGRTPPANIESLRPGLSNAEILTLPNASHDLFRQPEAFAAALKFFRSQ